MHPDTKTCPPTPLAVFFPAPSRGKVGMGVRTRLISQERLMIEANLLLNANRRHAVSIRTTTDDLK